ncbi:hypothetical protein AM1BK_35910 [Neobacillus kokaensis]|uniref:Uncharacterized protein n=1 Tax=Neobacillus kokaensis TaxID=2759023 RepID=A0ABQ3N7T7_9BACI|nr:hypothetical protein AM1BK_35910 [Neobacillus kokaensis]
MNGQRKITVHFLVLLNQLLHLSYNNLPMNALQVNLLFDAYPLSHHSLISYTSIETILLL